MSWMSNRTPSSAERRGRCSRSWRWVIPGAAVLAILHLTGCLPGKSTAQSAGEDAVAWALAGVEAPTVQLVNDRERGEFVILVGPIDLPAHDPEAMEGEAEEEAGHDHADEAGEAGGEHGHGETAEEAGAPLTEPTHHGAHAPVWPPVGTVEIPVDAGIHGFEWSLRDAAGHDLPTEVLHHVNVIDPEHRELFLPISRRLAAAGEETGEMSLPPFLFGVPVRKGQPLVISAMLHNPTGERHEDVVLEFRLQYVEGSKPWPLFDVQPFQMDVAFPAGDKSFDLPRGRTTESYEAKPAVSGRMLGIGGHVHEHATRIAFEDVTTGEVIWEAAPVVEEGGGIDHVPVGRLYKHLGTRIHADHTYRVSVTYENPTGETIRRGGMGVVGGVFRPDGEWPAADRDDPLYVLDRKHYMREVYGTMDEIETAVEGVGESSDPGEDETTGSGR